MTNTLTKKEKIQKLVKEWNKFKTMTQEEIGDELGVAGRTIYVWRSELKKRGINLELKVGGRDTTNVFDDIKS